MSRASLNQVYNLIRNADYDYNVFVHICFALYFI